MKNKTEISPIQPTSHLSGREVRRMERSIRKHERANVALARAAGHEAQPDQDRKQPNYRLRRAVAVSALAASLPLIGAGGEHLLNAGRSAVERMGNDPNLGSVEPTQEQVDHMRETEAITEAKGKDIEVVHVGGQTYNVDVTQVPGK